MNTTTITDEAENAEKQKPGAYLAKIRLEKGYTIEYIAGKLHLRVQIIELLEADDYANLPEAVFIKGYLRAYAKLLDVCPEQLIKDFNSVHSHDRKFERTLWQSRKETHKAEHAVRCLTGVFALGVLIAVALWWGKNKEVENVFPSNLTRNEPLTTTKVESEIRLTDLSKMRSLLSNSYSSNYSSLEQTSE